MDNREYIIFNVSEINKIDFLEVLEDSEQTLRKSLDHTKAIVKWSGDKAPSFLDSLLTKEGPYTLEEISDIILKNEWSEQNLNNI